MLILIPPSEGKTKVKSTGIRFEKTNFQFEDEVKKIVFLLENLSELGEDLSSIYGTSQEKSELFHSKIKMSLIVDVLWLSKDILV